MTKAQKKIEMKNQNPIIESKTETLSVEKLCQMMLREELNCNPVGQRPPVKANPDNDKNKGIIQCLYNGIGIGLITVRDIRNCEEEEIKRIYPNNYYLVIDGGHRCRGIRDFMNNKFSCTINGEKKNWNKMTPNEKDHLMSRKINMEKKICTSMQAIEIFKGLNSTTKVNAYEMIMSDDQSKICRKIRELSRSYPEYGDNDCHEIFTLTDDDTAKHFTNVNERAIWHTYNFVALHKSMNMSNCDAGENDTKELLKMEKNGDFEVPQKAWDHVDQFWNFCLTYRKKIGKKISQDMFAALHAIWFKLQEEYKENFKLDMDTFKDEFEDIRVKLTGKTKNEYSTKTAPNLEDEETNIKELVRNYSKSYSDGEKTTRAANIMWDELLKANNGNPEECGITVLDSKRSVPRNIRYQKFIEAKRRCYIDLHTESCRYGGNKMESVDDCVLAHDKPHAYGGKTEDGVIMCKHCHDKQGMMDLEEFIEHLQSKEKKNRKKRNAKRR